MNVAPTDVRREDDAKEEVCQNTTTAVTSVHYTSLWMSNMVHPVAHTEKKVLIPDTYVVVVVLSFYGLLTWPSLCCLHRRPRAESSDIHGFVAHAWDVKCPSIRKMGASLWISDVIFFHPIPSSSCSTCGQFVRNSEMPLATLNFLETKITWKDCYLKWKKCQQIRSPILKG